MVDHDDPYMTARIRGQVTHTTTGDEAWEVIDRLAVRYTGEPFPFRPPTSRMYVVEVHRVRSTQLGFEHRPTAA